MMEKHMETNTKVNRKKLIVSFIIELLIIIIVSAVIIGNVVIDKYEQKTQKCKQNVTKSGKIYCIIN